MARILIGSGIPLLCAYAGPLAPEQNCQKLADSEYTRTIDGVTWAYCSQLHLANHALDEPRRTAGTPADPLYDRNLAIVALSGVGWKHSRIARLFGIVTPRVDQIVARDRSARMAKGDPREW
jgi:hypothetical protein